jgi:CheY-like chemotaxis protein
MPMHISFRPRILVIENAGLARAELCNLLESWGYRVEEAGDGSTGLRKAMAWRPEAAIIAADVPPSDGYEIGRELRVVFGPGIFLIGRAASDEPLDSEQFLDAGFDEVLRDNADSDEFCTLLGRALGVAAPSKSTAGSHA